VVEEVLVSEVLCAVRRDGATVMRTTSKGSTRSGRGMPKRWPRPVELDVITAWALTWLFSSPAW